MERSVGVRLSPSAPIFSLHGANFNKECLENYFVFEDALKHSD